MMRRLFAIGLAAAVTAAGAAVTHHGDFEAATGTGQIFGASTSPADYDQTSRGSVDYPFFLIVDNPVRQGTRAARVQLCDSTGTTGACPYSQKDVDKTSERRSLNIADDVTAYGQTKYMAWSVLFPTDQQFRSDDTVATISGWTMIQQIMLERLATGSYLPGFSIITRGGDYWTMDSSGRTANFGTRAKGVWHDFLIAYKPHCTDGSGYTQIKYRQTAVNGAAPAWTTVYTSTARSIPSTWCAATDRDYLYGFHSLLYRSSELNGTLTMYFDGPYIATTESEAEAFFEDQAATQIATPGGIDIDWGDGTASAVWTQTGESNVDDWTAQQCWDDRPCVESTVATKTIEIAEPWGKSLVLRVRGNGKSGYADSEWGSLTEARAYPEAVTNVRMVGAQVAATEITSSSTITLSTIGATDWVHYGLAAATDVNRKSGASIQIGTMTHVQASAGRVVGADTRAPIAWTGGTPTATEAGTRAYLAHGWSSALQGSGFSLSAPAASTSRTLHLYLVTVKAAATLTATLNGAATTTTIGTAGVVQHWDVEIAYSGSGLLDLTWLKTDTGTDTRVGIVGAALE